MKKIVFLCLLFVGLTSVAQEAKWYDNFEEAAKVSKQTNKPILANFTGSDWCGWCIRLDKEVFSQKEFKKWANENVVLLTVDFPRRKKLDPNTAALNKSLEQAFGVRGFPTIWLFGITDLANPKKDIIPYGKTGYVRGGANKWIASISPYLPKNQS